MKCLKKVVLLGLCAFFVVTAQASEALAQEPAGSASIGQVDRCYTEKIAPENRVVAASLAFFLGNFGVCGAHRIYVGKYNTAALQFLTLGGLGVWQLIDLIFILGGEFTNAKGEKLKDWA